MTEDSISRMNINRGRWCEEEGKDRTGIVALYDQRNNLLGGYHENKKHEETDESH
jgi:hypothetical protein